jgi:hypothetical protein
MNTSWDETNATLDWVGELRSNPDVVVGSFDAGVLQVQVRCRVSY